MVGHIEKEFLLVDCLPALKTELNLLKTTYENYFNRYLKSLNCCTHNVAFVLNNVWVNFQKKYEFNPIHNHSGVYSFVIWVKVPYKLIDEKQFSPGREANCALSGKFCFVYTDVLGAIHQHTIPVDSSYEGKIILFPAKMSHTVYPFFSSDDYRISVSGNISLDTSKSADN